MPFIRLVLFCADVVHDFMSQNGPYIAAAISFYTLFGIFPLILAVISVLSFMIGNNDTEYVTKLVEEITKPILQEGINDPGILKAVFLANLSQGLSASNPLLNASIIPAIPIL